MIRIEFDIKDNKAIALDNDIIIGKCEFLSNKDEWNIVHTEVDKKYQGQGIAKRLVEMIIQEANKNNKNIVAKCSYARRILER